MRKLLLFALFAVTITAEAQFTAGSSSGVTPQLNVGAVTLFAGYEFDKVTTTLNYISPLTDRLKAPMFFSADVRYNMYTQNDWIVSPGIGTTWVDYAEKKVQDQQFSYLFTTVISTPIIYDRCRFQSVTTFTASTFYTGVGFSYTFYRRE